MKRLPAPYIQIRQWLQNPHAITVAAFVLAGVFLGIASWLIHRNVRCQSATRTHSECRRRGAAFLVMHIESTSHEPPYRTGTLKGLTLAEIQAMLPDIQPDTRPSADLKVTIMWRFFANAKPCGIWNYRWSYEVRGELSTFGPDGVFDTFFGKAYAPD